MTSPTSTTTLFIGGLSPQTTTRHLHDAFTPFGEILNITLPRPEAPNDPSPHRGFGYIEFATAGDGADAVDNMDQAEMFGRVIKVARARERQTGGEGGEGVLGGKTALWEQEGWLKGDGEGEGEGEGIGRAGGMDPMEGLEGLDVAGPKGS